MSYLNAYIDQCPAFGWEVAPAFKTEIVELKSGREDRFAMWANVRHRFSLPFMNITRESYRGIKQLHLVCRGRLHAFRYQDPLDNEAEDEQFGVGDGVTTVFQLAKRSTIDGIAYDRGVFAPVTAAITVNNVPVDTLSSGADAEVDMERGTVTFLTPPTNGHVLRWTGVFDCWVRFASDELPFSLDSANASEKFINGTVDLLEVPPPPAE